MGCLSSAISQQQNAQYQHISRYISQHQLKHIPFDYYTHKLIYHYCDEVYPSGNIPVDIISIISIYYYNTPVYIPKQPILIKYEYITQDKKHPIISFKWNYIQFQYYNSSLTSKYGTLKKRKHQCILLGTTGSGKSTFLKQLSYIFDGSDLSSEKRLQASEQRLAAIKPVLKRNVIEAMKTLASMSTSLAEEGKDTGVSMENVEIRDKVSQMYCREYFSIFLCKDFKTLLEDEGIKNTIKYKKEFEYFQLIDSYQYLFNNMHKYCVSNYVPTFMDFIHCYESTKGINKIKFALTDRDVLRDDIYEISDFGGWPNTSKQMLQIWTTDFDVSMLFYVINLGGYCEEYCHRNKLKQDIAFFGELVNTFKGCSGMVWIIILNKYDLFREYVLNCKIPINDYFNDFDGDNEDIQQIIEFVIKKLLYQIKDSKDSEAVENTCIHFLVTNAINTECIRSTFEYIHHVRTQSSDSIENHRNYN
eukprot:119201_1